MAVFRLVILGCTPSMLPSTMNDRAWSKRKLPGHADDSNKPRVVSLEKGASELQRLCDFVFDVCFWFGLEHVFLVFPVSRKYSLYRHFAWRL